MCWPLSTCSSLPLQLVSVSGCAEAAIISTGFEAGLSVVGLVFDRATLGALPGIRPLRPRACAFAQNPVKTAWPANASWRVRNGLTYQSLSCPLAVGLMSCAGATGARSFRPHATPKPGAVAARAFTQAALSPFSKCRLRGKEGRRNARRCWSPSGSRKLRRPIPSPRNRWRVWGCDCGGGRRRRRRSQPNHNDEQRCCAGTNG